LNDCPGFARAHGIGFDDRESTIHFFAVPFVFYL
jgi:hypothetical protein